MDELKIFIDRLKQIGIEIKVSGNVPWIYLDEVNGNRVVEKGNQGNHGYTIAWYVKDGIKLASDMSGVFELVRKYK